MFEVSHDFDRLTTLQDLQKKFADKGVKFVV